MKARAIARTAGTYQVVVECKDPAHLTDLIVYKDRVRVFRGPSSPRTVLLLQLLECDVIEAEVDGILPPPTLTLEAM